MRRWIRNTMSKYKVRLLPRAFRDLDNIFEYIANEKLSPDAAKRQTNRIKEAIRSLSSFPESHQERQEGRYADQGYRQLLIGNYMAVFRIDEVRKIVYIVTVQYKGRNI